MKLFTQLDKDDFQKHISMFIKANDEFCVVFDISNLDGVSGYYMMVLDEYCQVYIGTTNNLKRRIMQHWLVSKPFDRLLCPIGAVNTSVMSIDSFRAMDTTRVFIASTKNLYEYEDDYISEIPSVYLCNRLGGGRVTGGLLQAIGMMKSRMLKRIKQYNFPHTTTPNIVYSTAQNRCASRASEAGAAVCPGFGTSQRHTRYTPPRERNHLGLALKLSLEAVVGEAFAFLLWSHSHSLEGSSA